MKKQINRRLMLLAALTFFFKPLFASELSNYIAPVTNITLGIGALIGVIGGLKVYWKWNSSEQEITGEAWAWAGACIFLVLSSIVVRAFMGY